jgi:hypothetical protein
MDQRPIAPPGVDQRLQIGGALMAAAWRTAVALVVLSAAALADDDFPKVTAPSTPPDLILSCRYLLTSRDVTVEVWNSGVVRQETGVDSAQVTFARIDILTSRQLFPSHNFWEVHDVIDRVSGDLRIEVRFVDASGQPATPSPEVKLFTSPAVAHCQALRSGNSDRRDPTAPLPRLDAGR